MELPLSISDTQIGLIAERFSAVDLVDTYLSRIGIFDKKLNSFNTVTQETAYEQARKVDKILKEKGESSFKEYPLLGTVVAYKDLFLTKNIRTTASSNVLKSYIPAYSATFVERMQESGAICIGKTNCDAWAHGASGENSDFGPTKNPWNEEYVPGGSSSGSASAVASNFCLVATGTDTGGSIRQPANFCGVVGFKPTYGAVSRYGIVAMASSLDSIGHFTHCIDDTEKIFNVVKGEDGKDGTVKNFNYKMKQGKIKIGLPKEYFIEGIDNEVKENVINSTKIFEKENIEIIDIHLPNTKYAISVYYIIQPAEVSSNLGRYDGIRYGNDRASFGDEAKRRIMLGTYVLSSGYYDAYYLKAMKVRSKIIEDFDKAFESVDAIIAPVSPTPPFKIGEKSASPLQMYLADIFTVAANLAGIPGIAIPSGFSSKGLPLGFQLLGPRFSEPELFNLGRKYENSSGFKSKTCNLIE